MSDDDIKAALPVLRAALERHWSAWATEKNRPQAATGASMCRYTAVFLVHVLGWPWQVRGGDPYFEGHQAGFFDGTRWQAHYWVTDGKRVVDLTADQFGAEALILTHVDDPRYGDDYSEEELSDALEHVTARAANWARDFALQNPGFLGRANR